jgi:MFS family permease
MTHRTRWRDWWVVFACLGCQIGMGAGGYIFPVFLKPVVDDLGWTRTAYAFANPIMSTTVALAGPLVGWVVDRRGPRAVLAAGAVLMSGAVLLAAGMQTTAQFYAIALLIGLGVACLGDLPTGRAIANRFERQRGFALGVVYIGSSIGGALVPLAATALAATGSWRAGFSGIGSALLVLVLPLALSVPRPVPGTDAGTSARGDPFAWRDVLRGRDFWMLFWVLFAFYLYRLGLNTHLVAFLGDLGYSSLEAAGSYSLTLALGIAGKLVAGMLADRVGPRVAVLANFTIIAVASALLLVPTARGAMPTFLVLHGFATAAEDVVIPLIVAQRFGIENLGRVYGALLLALIPGGAVGPIVAGKVFDATGSYAEVFATFVVCNVLAVVALAVVRPGGASASDRGTAA